ncbi:MarR family transcriptional regulator [Paenibacillus sp. CAU 1782]
MDVKQDVLLEWLQRYEMANFVVERKMGSMLRELMPEELTVDQFKMLRYLRHTGSCTSTELAEIFCVAKSSITAIVSKLSDKGLIERLPERSDRRVINLELTEEGARICQLMEEQVQRVLLEIINNFALEEATVFIETYEKLANELTKNVE